MTPTPQIVLPGDPHVAFDHLAAYGLAAILEESAHTVTLVWTDTDDSRPVLTATDWRTAATVVHAHAARATQPGSWVMSDGQGASTSALFSPRVKAMTDVQQCEWYAQRHQFLDHAALTPLDHSLIGALGEPSYWNHDNGDDRPDNGASRWEMKTRNRGEEFIAHRLRLLASTVAQRTPEAVESGLSGHTLVDEVGKGKSDSRTPTGLASPGPQDNARAWCALWGLSLLAVAHRADVGRGAAVSRSAGHVGNHLRGTFYLPYALQPWPLARLRSVLVSRQLQLLAEDDDAAALGDLGRARDWLTSRGVHAVVRFPVHRSSNPNAPERWAERGTLVQLNESAG